MRTFLHIDMDAFFAAVEELDHPAWRGKPVIVGSDPAHGRGRGVVSTASYAARTYGVGSAMPISRAWKRCPHGIYVRPRMGRYMEVSEKIMAIFRSFTPEVQPTSLDEAFLDATGSTRLFGGAVSIAGRIKETILGETGLTCSVGISRIKSVAKIASDMEKPDGLTVVLEGTEKVFLAPLDVRRLWGVGQKAARVLAGAGIYKVGELQGRSKAELYRLFGKAAGAHYFNMAHAIDPREVNVEETAVSISHETTFLSDIQDRSTILRTLLWLADKVAARLRKHGVQGRVITLKYRTGDFKTFTRRVTLPDPAGDTNTIYETALRLAAKLEGRGKRVRLLGIGLSRLEPEKGVQQDLFDERGKRRRWAAEAAVDRVRARFGNRSIFRGRLLEGKERG